MAELYKSKYYVDLRVFLDAGWTEAEINTYFPLLESLNEEELLQLHRLVGIEMYKAGERVDKEMALHPLLNGRDTSKGLLISAIHRFNYMSGRSDDPAGAVIEIDEVDFLVTTESVDHMRSHDDLITLQRLIDGEKIVVRRDILEEALKHSLVDWFII